MGSKNIFTSKLITERLVELVVFALPLIIEWKLAGRGMCCWRTSKLQVHEISSNSGKNLNEE